MLQAHSLSQSFIKFLESESAAPSPHPAVSGYIDPHTDPDKPSLATASLLSSSQPTHSNTQSQPDTSIAEPMSSSNSEGSMKILTNQIPSASQNSFQSSILKTVLAD